MTLTSVIGLVLGITCVVVFLDWVEETFGVGWAVAIALSLAVVGLLVG